MNRYVVKDYNGSYLAADGRRLLTESSGWSPFQKDAERYSRDGARAAVKAFGGRIVRLFRKCTGRKTVVGDDARTFRCKDHGRH